MTIGGLLIRIITLILENYHFKYETSLMPMNEVIDKNRRHKILGANAKKAMTDKIKLLTMAQTRQRLTGKYDFRIVWTVNTRHDPDNIYSAVKFILDGMVAAGLLPKDNSKHVGKISNEIVRSASPRIDVYMTPVI